MKFNFKPAIVFFVFTLFLTADLWAQPANNTCATAVTLTVNNNCSPTGGTLFNAGTTNPTGSSCGNRRDVWYKFTVPSNASSVVIDVALTGASNLTTANTYIELFNTNNCTVNGNSTGGCNDISVARTYAGLTSGNTYYFRINTSVTPSSAAATFNVCVTTPTGSRMKEVFKQTILSGGGVLNYPWEITYGPDDSLWITEARGYKVYKMDPNTGAKRTVLDLTSNSTWLGAVGTGGADTLYAQQTLAAMNSNPNGWPQGGLAGLAIHPDFGKAVNPKNYVYVSYIHRYLYGTSPSGIFYRNKIVRFTYNTVTGRLESPSVVENFLPGSQDHNSQRLIIAPVTVGGTNYLFYGQGDMGAGQFGNRTRTNNAQNPNSYEGKILRFNLDTVGSVPWIPTNNPYSSTSAVWSIGMRNNQGLAYDSVTNILYGSAHGPYSDDEINIIDSFKNYGHPLVIGYADGNYNGNFTQGTSTSYSAGAPFTDNNGVSSCPPVGNETTRMNALIASAATLGAYKGPLFSAYPTPAATIANTWTTNTGNANWYSEAWSGLDIYQNKVIPGWNRSLVAAGLKWGRLIRLKLGPTGTTTMPSNSDSANTSDTITYFQSSNRYRDLAFAPNGKDIFLVMDNSSATSGPGVGNPTVPGCQGCVIKYTFLGYAGEASGLSSIPKTIDVTNGAVNTCNSGTPITIDVNNNSLWVPITGPDGNIMAEINAMGQNLGLVTSSFYQNSGAIRIKGGYRYLDRNLTISPAVTSFATPVKVRLYISKTEFDLLAADPLSGVTTINQLRVLKNSDPCGSSMTANTTVLVPTNTLLADLQQGANGYVLQVDVPSFSSFYFGGNNIVLPLQLLTFTGSLQNKTTTVLNWKTTNEVNTSYFIVERSADGQNFSPLGRVNAAGNPSVENNYSYNDFEVASLQSANVFYRLKMFDVSGTYRYSNVIKVTLPGLQNEITVTPNPVSSEAHANIVAAEACDVDWQVIDMAGRILLQNSTTLKKGNNSLDINISQLASASYFLKIKGSCFDLKTKFQKL